MIVDRLNESFSAITADLETLRKIHDVLKVERPGAYFEEPVKRGFKSPFDFFSSVQDGKLLVYNGHLSILASLGFLSLCTASTPEYTNKDIDDFLSTTDLPFEPYDFQIKAFRESVLHQKQLNKMCTSSGKSLTISLIAEFFRSKGKKGLLLVPNINLLTQFKNDIADYGLESLHENTHIIGGGSTDKNFNSSLTISTWQSLQDSHHLLDELDYLITDESHRFASTETSAIVQGTFNCKYKLAFTGTIPDDPVKKMQLIGLFGLPKTYITSKELIDRGLGTPIKINSILFNYNDMDKKLYKEIKASGRSKNKYPNQLAFLKEHEQRNSFIVSLGIRLRNKGNTLILFQHTEHGKILFTDTMKTLYPDVEVLNKHITGKKSFEFQKKYGVFFLNGEDDAKTRELTRKILEEHEDAVLIANYAILSTGVNIKRLYNLILGSPLKSYETITQSIGRLMRLYEGKTEANIYDLVDILNPSEKPSGLFYKQYQARLAKSYNPEEFPVKEIVYNLK